MGSRNKVRGAPPDALNRTAMAEACGVTRLTLYRWERRGLLTPHYVFRMLGHSVYYLPEQISELQQRRFWRSAAGTRAVRRLLRRQSQ
jgi:DNA-binding transcriptional MerR regulator